MAFYLGIDGGGTKTRCLLGDEATVLGTGTAGGSNVVRLGVAASREALHAAIRAACSPAKVAPDQISAICVGAAGAARPDIEASIREILKEWTSASVEVVGDNVIALEAAFGQGAGVIAIAGTGSIVFGRDVAGRTYRAGGWGFAISDEGSGQWIGRQAVSAIVRAHDAQHDTALKDMVLRQWNLENLDELVQAANATPPPEFPQLFPLVLRASETGDEQGRALLVEAGERLAGLVAMVVQRLSPHPPYAPVAMTGSVFRQSAEVRQVFYNQLKQRFPGLEVRNQLVDPVEGALVMARKIGRSRAG